MAIRDLFKRSETPPPARRAPRFRAGYDAGKVDRLTQSWGVSITSPDSDLERQLRPLRARSRDLAANNDHMSRFLHMVGDNVIGPRGVQFQARSRNLDGSLDKPANDQIETAFKKWGRFSVPTMEGGLDWIGLQTLAIQTVARDGEFIAREITGRAAGNEFGYALQLLEADFLDEDLRDHPLSNGNNIRMGVERNSYGRPVAYWFRTKHPGDHTYNVGAKDYERVTADKVIHLFVVKRPGQSRGVPWAHTAMKRMNMLGGYEEAELVAARVAASKMGFFTSPDGEGFGDDTDENGNFIQDADAGTFEVLPDGYDFKQFDPQHPTSAFADFEKAVLRGIASGLGVSYNSLANDLQGVNFSSLRHGLAAERDNWQSVQAWMVAAFHDRVFRGWLKMALTSGVLNPLPFLKHEKFSAVEWQPRGWPAVDPTKEVAANAAAVELKVKSRTEIAAESGRDFRDTLAQIAEEEKMIEESGIKSPAPAEPKGKQNAEDDEDDEDDPGKPDD